MSITTKRRRGAVIAASAATGVAAILSPASTPAIHVQPASRQPTTGDGQSTTTTTRINSPGAAPLDETAILAGAATLPECTSWTDVNVWNPLWGPERIHVPSVTFGDGVFDCTMSTSTAPGNQAVFKLQTAIKQCYPPDRYTQPVTPNYTFGPETKLALGSIQGRTKWPDSEAYQWPTGVYGPGIAHTLLFPEVDANNNWVVDPYTGGIPCAANA